MGVEDRSVGRFLRFGWVIIAINALMAIVMRLAGPELPPELIPVGIMYIIVQVFYVILHMRYRLGAGNLLLFFCISFFLSYALEALGVNLGLLFGDYHYTSFLGPQLWSGVPAAVPIAWFLMLYCVLLTAELLLFGVSGRQVKHNNRWIRFLILPNLAAGLMTMWDLVMDPRAVYHEAWIWHTDGPFYGVPLSNFRGWYLTSLLIIFLYLLLERKRFGTGFSGYKFWYNFPVLGYYFAVFNNITESFRLGMTEVAVVMGCFWLILSFQLLHAAIKR